MKRKPKTETPVPVPKAVEALLAEVMSQPPPPYVPPKEYVYLTKSDFGYKIGRTTHPEIRPLQVAGNMPIKLEVIAVIEVPDSKEWESRLHGHFADKRLRGEWFSLSESDVEIIKGIPKNWDDFSGGEIPF
jgi:hypothetical protein